MKKKINASTMVFDLALMYSSLFYNPTFVMLYMIYTVTSNMVNHSDFANATGYNASYNISEIKY